MEEADSIIDNVLNSLRKCTRDQLNAVKNFTHLILFKLLVAHAGDRNPYAPIIYKILTFSLIENH